LRRYEKERKAEEKEKGNEMITFIDVFIDLFLCNQYHNWENEKKKLSRF
jgi:hypothetical protein